MFNGPTCGLFGRFKKDRVLLKLYKQSLHSIFTESIRRMCERARLLVCVFLGLSCMCVCTVWNDLN